MFVLFLMMTCTAISTSVASPYHHHLSSSSSSQVTRGQCPRPEDIHPCTCFLIPKHDKFDEDDEDDEESVVHQQESPSSTSLALQATPPPTTSPPNQPQPLLLPLPLPLVTMSTTSGLPLTTILTSAPTTLPPTTLPPTTMPPPTTLTPATVTSARNQSVTGFDNSTSPEVVTESSSIETSLGNLSSTTTFIPYSYPLDAIEDDGVMSPQESHPVILSVKSPDVVATTTMTPVEEDGSSSGYPASDEIPVEDEDRQPTTQESPSDEVTLMTSSPSPSPSPHLQEEIESEQLMTTTMTSSSSSSSLSPEGEEDDDSKVRETREAMSKAGDSSHWSLWESMLICKNVKSARVMADTLKSMAGFHYNYIVLDGVRLPQPFPFSLFDKFSFDVLEFLNISSLQFADNFSDKDRNRDYYYGRSNKGPSRL